MKIIVLVALMLSGCAMIDHNNRVPDWPALKEEVRVVSYEEMRKNCTKYGSIGSIIFACSEIWFEPPKCVIWVTSAGGWAEEHERQHCRGYEHIGGTGLKDMLTRYKEQK